MPVNGGRHLKLIDEAHPQTVTLTRSQLHARRLPAIGPGGRPVPRHELDVERRGDQFVVVAGNIGRLPQPVTNAAGAKANHTEAGQSGEKLSAG